MKIVSVNWKKANDTEPFCFEKPDAFSPRTHILIDLNDRHFCLKPDYLFHQLSESSINFLVIPLRIHFQKNPGAAGCDILQYFIQSSYGHDLLSYSLRISAETVVAIVVNFEKRTEYG